MSQPPSPSPATDVHPDSDVDFDDPELYLNRELSELAFQRRVLNEALDDRNPLLERVRFLAIFTKNLDEFFMKRIGGLKQQIDAGVTDQTADGRTPYEQWTEVHETAGPMLDRQAACYREEIRPALADAGIRISEYDDLTDAQETEMRSYFEESVLPTLTPLSFDPAHPFPFISNLSLSLAVLTRKSGQAEPTFTRVKIPQNRPRLVEVDTAAGRQFVLLEEVIRANLDLLLPNVEIVDTALFKLTRNAEVRRNEEVAEDLIEVIQEVLEQRRFASAVRLELEAGAPDAIRDLLTEELDLAEREVYEVRGPIDYREFMDLTDLDRPDLKLDDWSPLPHPRLPKEEGIPESPDGHAHTVFDRIRRDDILLHHPYHSFTDTVQRFLDEAAHDPDVLAIKAAIYRTASDSKVIQSLIDAADNGKQVAVMVELKARFDEQNNLEWVRTLEEEGIHVAYGTVGLKTHTKTALVVREEDDGVQLYSHVATGNYHSGTAKGYVDLGLLTADRDIGQDLVKVFNFFTGPSLDEEFRKLLISPVTMRRRLTEMIRREADHARADRRARIVVKANALEDPGLVEELYRASMAGVDIDLVIRDICRLRPGLDGVSETVDVYSIVDRFLEHSRIFYFENAGDPEYYTGSADWMTRNLDNRVEAVTPVADPAIREQLRFVLELCLQDNRSVWEMNDDGTYDQRRPGPDESELCTQDVLMDRTRAAHESGDERGIVPAHPAVETSLLLESATDAASTASRPDDGAASDPDAVSVAMDGDTSPTSDPDAVSSSEMGDGADDIGDDDDDRLPTALVDHPDRWYVPDSSRYEFAVRTPDGDRDYRKTPEAAAALVERYWA
ncbi:polyphosphate kinase 1 [Salinigranum salinum]|uniref:polyphosphate kinase 1 n=1 Tax=Salinigranum salinum TaxID=1364937 RepID=UPI001260D807|nr:polyphosphate kinase 1 [Salinigranum salinum]